MPPDSCAPRPAPGGDVWGDRPRAGAELRAAGGVPVPSDGDLDRAGLAFPVREGPGAEVDGGVWGRGQRVRGGGGGKGWLGAPPSRKPSPPLLPLPPFGHVRIVYRMSIYQPIRACV